MRVLNVNRARTDLRRSLVDAVLRGEKTATAGLLTHYELEGDGLARVGERWVLLDYDDKPVAGRSSGKREAIHAGVMGRKRTWVSERARGDCHRAGGVAAGVSKDCAGANSGR